MKQYLERFQEWFRALAPRERVMVSVCAALVAVTLLYVGLWEPLTRTHHQREDALSAARAMSQRLEDMAAVVQRQHAGGGTAAANRSLSLLAAVDQSSKSGALGKPLTRIQPDGDHSVKVWADDVSFDGLMRWIVELDSHYGITVDTADIERSSAAGTVNAKLSLVRP